LSVDERQPDGTLKARNYPYGDGTAQILMVRLVAKVEDAYFELLSEEDSERLGETAEVPVIREGVRHYEDIRALTLRDLPAVLDTFVVLEQEREREKLEEAERKAAERKERERVRAKERRKLMKLGEW
jgi:hypothetical protein